VAAVLKRGWKVILLTIAIVAVPTAAFAAIGTFTSATGTPAVTGVNSSALTGVSGVRGVASHVGTNLHYGVSGTASGTGGIGVRGDGAAYGVYSGGNLGVASGHALKCAGCVNAGDIASGAATAVYAGYKNGPISVNPFSVTTLATLNIPVAGKYSVTAKAWVQSVAGTGPSQVNCSLVAGTDSDQTQVDATDGNVSFPDEPVRNETMTLLVVHSFTAAGPVKLNCQNPGGGNTNLRMIKIVAVKVPTLSNVAMP
jgi:hypothetical protein